MQVSVEALELPLERKVNIAIPADWIVLEVDKRIRDRAKDYCPPGFRPGKVPFKIVQKRFAPQVMADYINEVLPHWLNDAFNAKELKVVGLISIALDPYDHNGDYEFSVTAELHPEIPISAYEGLPIEVSESKITEHHIQQQLQDIAVKNAEFVETDKISGDHQRIALQYRTAANPDAEYSPEIFYFTGLSPHMHEFDNALQGIGAGDQIKVQVDPLSLYEGAKQRDDWKQEMLILIKTVERSEDNIIIDDALAEKLGIKEGGLEKLTHQVKIDLERHMENWIFQINREQIKNALTKRNAKSGQVILPRCLYLKTSFYDKWLILDNHESSSLDEGQIEHNKKETLYYLIVNHLQETQSYADYTYEEFREYIQPEASRYDDPEAYIENAYSNRSMRHQIISHMREKIAVGKIIETANSKNKFLEYDPRFSIGI